MCILTLLILVYLPRSNGVAVPYADDYGPRRDIYDTGIDAFPNRGGALIDMAKVVQYSI